MWRCTSRIGGWPAHGLTQMSEMVFWIGAGQGRGAWLLQVAARNKIKECRFRGKVIAGGRNSPCPQGYHGFKAVRPRLPACRAGSFWMSSLVSMSRPSNTLPRKSLRSRAGDGVVHVTEFDAPRMMLIITTDAPNCSVTVGQGRAAACLAQAASLDASGGRIYDCGFDGSLVTLVNQPWVSHFPFRTCVSLVQSDSPNAIRSSFRSSWPPSPPRSGGGRAAT